MPNELPSAARARFTEAQRQAIEAMNPELLVSAAAGSGKTMVLVERIVKLIAEDGLRIDRMLIVTFTRAAAAEMRTRLENVLRERAEDPSLTGRQRDAVRTGAEDVGLAQISTIHSFCQRVVKQHFDLAEIDPQFSLMDERTKETVFNECMDDALEEVYRLVELGDRDFSDIGLTRGDAAALTQRFTDKDLTEMIRSLYSFLIARPDPDEWLAAQAAEDWDDPEVRARVLNVFRSEIIAVLVSALSACERAADRIRAGSPLPEAYIALLEADHALMTELLEAAKTDLTKFLALLTAAKWPRKPVFKPQTSDEEIADKAFQDMRGGYKTEIGDFRKTLPGPDSLHWADLKATEPSVRGLCGAMRLFMRIFRDRKRDLAMIDFNDLEHYTLFILRDPERRRVISRKFDAVFVDEYQDVSRLQESILNALKQDRRENPLFCFYVGDVKQSIYRFRQACPDLFLAKQRDFSPDADALSRRIALNCNFRSRPEVLAMVNRVFAHVMHRDLTEIEYDDDARLVPRVPPDNDPPAELHVLNSSELNAAQARRAEAEWIAGDIRRILADETYLLPDKNGPRRVTPDDIVILASSSRKVGPDLAEAFELSGLPLTTDSNPDALRSIEVQIVLQFLSLMCNGHNDLALLSALRSPIFGLTDEELAQIRILSPGGGVTYASALEYAAGHAEEPLRTRLSGILKTIEDERHTMFASSVTDYLWDFLQRSGLFAIFGAMEHGETRQANLCALCTRAAVYERQFAGGMPGFVDSMLVETFAGSDMTPGSQTYGTVRLMTVHHSKGLEFPIVYVMGLGDAMLHKSETSYIALDDGLGLAPEYRNPDMRTRRSTALQEAVGLRSVNAERAERARVLYVAMTRAKHQLILTGCAPEKDCSPEQYLSRSFDCRENDDSAVRGASSFLDWILQCVRPDDELYPGGLHGTALPHTPLKWRVFFHPCAQPPERIKPVSDDVRVLSYEDLLPKGVLPPPGDFRSFVLPRSVINEQINRRRREAMPQKVGVTALCRAMDILEKEGTAPSETLSRWASNEPSLDEERSSAALEETVRTKRWPLDSNMPVSITSLPRAPEFITGPRETNTPLERGEQTHRVLSLVRLDVMRAAGEDPAARREAAQSEIDRLKREVLLPAEAECVEDEPILRFWQSPVALRLLRSPEVHREWRFVMRLEEPFHTVLQGVIDLCFLEEDEWVLLDYKTDRVAACSELWTAYSRQLTYYRDALNSLTGHRVREMGLFSLFLGRGCFRSQTEPDAPLREE